MNTDSQHAGENVLNQMEHKNSKFHKEIDFLREKMTPKPEENLMSVK